ncbi:unnamed protein product [Didymodactylos carnosus]|uniref:VWFA domain-containing protein n=1 Tax=Didymodactylos carnosus TaxID=1234261 RepID=A0A814X3V1_9BILA|nr:unnamed protein product [Didymodactylos carnosus]CAF1210940.1 unnamed protein product [Didymodactylos carnosus]CAF3974938.1 unnamed protein product [Didymodactylos carnosus]CAF3981643.1 unnamed protein product [Didymodactylos carnosus]
MYPNAGPSAPPLPGTSQSNTGYPPYGGAQGQGAGAPWGVPPPLQQQYPGSQNTPYPPSTSYSSNQQYPTQQNNPYLPPSSTSNPYSSANPSYGQQQPSSYHPGQQGQSTYGSTSSPYGSTGMGATPDRYQQGQPSSTSYGQGAPYQSYQPGGSSYPPAGQSGYPPSQQFGYSQPNQYQPGSNLSGPPYSGAGSQTNQQPPYGVPSYQQQTPGGYGNDFAYQGGAQQRPGNYSTPYQQGSRPTYGDAGGNDVRMQRINQVAQRYEINPSLVNRLRVLEGYEILLLCDDSGSMNTPLETTSQTRWDELKQIINIILDICIIFDSNGVDIYFLNRRPVQNVTNISQLNECFSSKPQGMTPIVPVLRNILQTKGSQAQQGKKLLIFIATDGAPTNDQGQVDIQGLEYVIRNERNAQTTYVSFLACTDDNESVAYLSNWDKQMQNVDVVDDYRTEKQEIQRQRGYQYPFSYGDYIVKALLGAIDPQLDALDERPT